MLFQVSVLLCEGINTNPIVKLLENRHGRCFNSMFLFGFKGSHLSLWRWTAAVPALSAPFVSIANYTELDDEAGSEQTQQLRMVNDAISPKFIRVAAPHFCWDITRYLDVRKFDLKASKKGVTQVECAKK